MNNIKLFFVAIALLVSSVSFAQFSNNSNQYSATTGATDGWSTLWVEWNPSTFKSDQRYLKRILDGSQSFTGISAGYSHALNVLSGTPLFVETGVGFQYSFCTYIADEDYYGYDDEEEFKLSMFSVKVPLNLLYKLNQPNSSVSLLPFAGLYARYNIFGKAIDKNKNDEDYDLFDIDDEFWTKKEGKRFQMGWSVGLKALLGQKILLGVSYCSDISECSKDSNISNASITLGYTF